MPLTHSHDGISQPMIRFSDYRLIGPATAAWLSAAAIIQAITRSTQPPVATVISALVSALITAVMVWPHHRYQARHGTYPIGSVRAGVALSLIVSTLAGFSALIHATNYIRGPLVNRCRSSCVITARIDQQPRRITRGWLTRLRPDAQPATGIFLITSQHPGANEGDQLIARGRIEPFGTPPTIGLLKPQTVRIQAKSSPAQRFRRRFITHLMPLEADTRGLIAGMSIGDSSDLSAPAREAMRVTSTTHLTAISGMHLGIIVMTLHILIPGRPRSKILLLAVIISLLIVIVGPRPSVIRAASMAAVLALAHLAGRATQAQTSLALVVIGWIIVNPWLAVSIGFILSVAATAAVVTAVAQTDTAYRRNERPRAQYLHKLRPLVSIPLAAAVSTAPILVAVMGYLPVYSVLANVLVLPAVAATTMAGLGGALCANIWPDTAWIPLIVARLGADWILAVSQFCAGLPLATIARPGASWIASGCVGVTAMVALRRVLPFFMRHRIPHEPICGIE
ncbi:MAG: ComEC/Rec2 family competence protein [Actinomycetaceae bacterium]|nr:ComEC/Rec2 family competence protein [Actinomycetaceae bacterium]